MIRIAHLSDSHFDERGRLADVVAVHAAFLDQALAEHVDLIVHAGDWYERRSTPAERSAVADFLQAASRVAPVFGVKGNHDQPGDLDILPRLDSPDNPVEIVDRPGIYGSGHHRIEVCAIPWFDKAHVAALLPADAGAEAARLTTIQAAGLLLDSLRAQIAAAQASGPVIVVGHLMVAGSETSTGQVIQGITVELSPADLHDLGASYVALGHVHKAQEWFGGRVAYSGSPHRCNFGEPEAKGWRLVTLEDDGTFVSNEFRELPARRMVRLEKDWRESVGQGEAIASPAELDAMKDALVRWRVQIRAQDLQHLDRGLVERFLIGAGAAEVQVEAVVEAQERARAPELARATTTADKVRAYIGSRGLDVEVDRVLGKVAELEREAGNAAS